MAVADSIERFELFEFEDEVDYYRTGALIGLAMACAASVRILYDITVILGGSVQLLVGVMAAVIAAWLVAQQFPLRTALAIFGAIATASFVWYFLSVGGDLVMFVTAPYMIIVHTLNDSLTILTGMSVLTIGETDVWARSFAPAPIFLAWYLGFRRHYTLASLVAGGTMLVFVFSGDLGWWWSLFGSMGIVLTVGFGTLEERRASSKHVEWLVILVAVMATTALLIPLIPGGGAMGPLSIIDDDELEGGQTIESNVVGSGEQLQIIGDVDLSPEVRFTIQSEDDVYWRTGVYDRYTGSGWARTGDLNPYTGPRDGIESGDTVMQNVRIESPTDRLPAAQRPTSISGIDDVSVSQHGSFVANEELEAGETYRVASVLPDPDDVEVGADYPTGIQEHYTQLPEDMPDRVYEVTAELVGDADGPVEKAQIIEAWLQQEKDYSWNVSRPSGDVADAFIFEMEAGYCTYFATAMVAMLRSADVPARMAVGYANGQQVAEDTYVVRSMNSHAWVEVYVPNAGWMTFDPTPGSSWANERTNILEEARADGLENVDTEESEGLPFDYEPDVVDENGDENDTNNETDLNGDNEDDQLIGGADDPIPDPGEVHNFGIDLDEWRDAQNQHTFGDDDDDGLWLIPDRDVLALFLIVLTGLLAGAHRVDLHGRLRRQMRLRYHRNPSGSLDDFERSLERLEWVLSSRYRPRRPHETHRKYHRMYAMSHDDDRVDHLYTLCERARFAGEVDDGKATEAVELANAIVAESVYFGGRLLPSKPNTAG